MGINKTFHSFRSSLWRIFLLVALPALLQSQANAQDEQMLIQPALSDQQAEEKDPLADGTYLIPANKKNRIGEALVQVVDGLPCYLSLIAEEDDHPVQIEIFWRDELELISIRKEGKHQVYVRKNNEPTFPEQISAEEKAKLRAISLSVRLLLNTNYALDFFRKSD